MADELISVSLILQNKATFQTRFSIMIHSGSPSAKQRLPVMNHGELLYG